MSVSEPDVDSAGTVGMRGDTVRSIATAVLLAVFAVGATYMALGFGPEARRLPLVVGVPLCVMAFLNLGLTLRDGLRPTPAVAEPSEQADRQDASDEGDEAGSRDHAETVRTAQASITEFEDTGEGLSFRASLTAVAVVTGLFMLLGLIPATVLFTIGYMRFVGRESWLRTLVTTALLIVLFWLFRTLLSVRFYEGWLAAEDYIPYLLPF